MHKPSVEVIYNEIFELQYAEASITFQRIIWCSHFVKRFQETWMLSFINAIVFCAHKLFVSIGTKIDSQRQLRKYLNLHIHTSQTSVCSIHVTFCQRTIKIYYIMCKLLSVQLVRLLYKNIYLIKVCNQSQQTKYPHKNVERNCFHGTVGEQNRVIGVAAYKTRKQVPLVIL